MKKEILIIMMAMLLASTAYAEVCGSRIDQICDILSPITVNASNKQQVYTGQISNITITNSTGFEVVNNSQMTNGSYGAGIHNFTFRNITVGRYSIRIVSVAGADYGRVSDSFTVVTNISSGTASAVWDYSFASLSLTAQEVLTAIYEMVIQTGAW